MAPDRWQIRVVLSSGETRHLAGSQGTADEATSALEDFKGTADEATRAIEDFEKGKSSQFRDDWIETTDGSVIARAHIVEASIVPL
jgi:hypothetical protein